MTRLQPSFMLIALIASLAIWPGSMSAQGPSDIHYDDASKVFRIDAGGVTYAF